MKTQPTEADFQKVLDRLKAKDDYFDERIEFGKFLFRHIGSLTPQERKRYDELNEFLKDKPL